MGSLVAARRLCNCCSSPSSFLRASSSCAWASASWERRTVCGAGEFFLLTGRLRDGGSRDGEIFLQRFCSGLAQDQGFAHGDGFLLQAEHVLF